MYNKKFAPKMFAIVYSGRGPDGWPRFAGAIPLRADILVKEIPGSGAQNYGVALFYTGNPPNMVTASIYGHVSDMQIVGLGCKLFLPKFISVEE